MTEMTNIVIFPNRRGPASTKFAGSTPAYEFTSEELTILCRWYSAMRYAFPQVQGVMAVCHNERVSAVGLYGEAGTAPNCLLSKHEAKGRIYLLWATERDPPRIIDSLSEVTDAQITAIAPPCNEASWLDVVGWMKVFADRTIAGGLPPATMSPHPA
jgi:hypothetical protein